MEPTRILRIITRLNVGGPTRHVRLLMEGLDGARFQQLLVHGVCAPGEGEAMLAASGPRLCIPQLQRSISLRQDLAALKAMCRIARDFRPGIVHTHQGKAGFLGRWMARRLGIPSVHTYHGFTFEGYFNPLLAALIRRLERRAARGSGALICQSESQARGLLSHLGSDLENRLHVIPPALDAKALAEDPGCPDLRHEFGVPKGRRVLLFPARLVAIKRPLRAIALLSELSASVDAELWIAGEGPLAGAVREAAHARGLEDRVRLLGWRPALGSLLRGCDLLLLTSAQEGTPLSLIEAMAAGVPAACPAVGGVPEILGGAGILLDPRAPSRAWAASLKPALADDGALAELGRLGLERAAGFRPENLLRRVSDLYESVLS